MAEQAGRRGKRVEKWNGEKEDSEYETFKQHHQCNKDCSKLTKEQCINRRPSLFDLGRNERFAVLIGFLINEFLRDKTEDDPREAKNHFAYGIDLFRGGFKLVGHVKIPGLRTDLCGTCDQLISQIYNGSRMGTVVDDLRQRWDAHRKHIKAYELPSKELYAKHITSDNQQFPPGVKGTRVITFDFAQSVALPYGSSWSFLFQGQNGTGTHGPDSVISVVDYYLSQNHNGEEKLITYCDNCGGQNKNRFLIGHSAYLINSGRK
ncbi:hypothetical protein RvY_19176 [Ramazzottius varieornatus]|uniref:Uncharacterized protein n=1 Tax=Ramazzottius varieornatus TaxID=947166 RepID=A0A1D1WBN8_RAMVA|nr:hypothetical protein RvY_19176 [Ramazzottius varieornatus]